MEATRGKSVVIYLMRNDLRVHDNECLQWAHQNSDFVIPLFCFDKSILSLTAVTWHYKFAKTAMHRAKFILESVSDLRESLRKLGKIGRASCRERV